MNLQKPKMDDSSRSQARPRILVIEDHADTRRFLESMLGREFEVLVSENAVLGIELARNQRPDLILLDIMLPVLSGHDACSLLRQDEKTRDIPVIFLSAKGTVTDVVSGLEKGADDYIPKPFSPREVVARINAILRRSLPAGGPPPEEGGLSHGEVRMDRLLRCTERRECEPGPYGACLRNRLLLQIRPTAGF